MIDALLRVWSTNYGELKHNLRKWNTITFLQNIIQVSSTIVVDSLAPANLLVVSGSLP